MPSSSSSDNVATYTALPATKRQRTFPGRRKSVKAKPVILALTKDQSTLTQLEWVKTPSSSRVEDIDMSSDEDFEDTRPKKRRRKSKFDGKEVGQSTLTQFDRNVSARKAVQEFQEYVLDEDEVLIWEDSDAETPKATNTQGQTNRKRTLPWLRNANEEVEDVEPEIPETSQLDVPLNLEPTDMEPASIPVEPAKFQTPRKVRFQEVPSSQTPPSTIESVKPAINGVDNERSPLKEKNANVLLASAPAQLSPASQNISMKMLERVRRESRKVPLNDVNVDEKPQEVAFVALDAVDAIPAPQPATRTRLFTRTSTIQDSQSEGASLSTTSSNETIMPPPRKLQRVTTVQDSQFDDDDLLPESTGPADDDGDDFEIVEDSQFPEEDTQHGYFDPANSALDRDALRFRWTQTQNRLHDVDEEDSDAETDDGDLDRTYVRNEATTHVNGIELDLTTANAEEPSAKEDLEVKELGPPSTTKRPTHLETRRPDSRDDSAYESGDHAHHKGIQSLPSSPPLHTSQISTAVPTQASVQELSAPSANITGAIRRTSIIEPVTIQISPYKPFRHPEMLSSSPFPLPPWTSPPTIRATRQESDHRSSPPRSSQLAKLVDYSLPPPPPLSSSGRQTPASSSL